MSKNITHVFFDVDGLLLDTEGIYSEISSTFASKYGKVFTVDIKRKVMGKSQEESGKILISELGLDLTMEEYRKATKELEMSYFKKVQLLPGAEKLIRHLASNKVPIAIATGSSRESLGWKTQNHSDLFSLFEHVICGSDKEVKRSKPDPDIYLFAKNKFPECNKTENCLVFEDSENGVSSGLAANMNVVWIPDPRFVDKNKSFAGPVLKLNSLLEFVPEDFGLPKYAEA